MGPGGRRHKKAHWVKLFWKSHDLFSNSSKACCILQITVLKNWFGCQKKRKERAIIHCDKYTPFVTNDKPKHKENHLKTLEEDWNTSICTYKSIEKRDITLEPLCQASQKVCDKHWLFMGIRCSKFHCDDLKTVKEVWDTALLYYGFVRISKRFMTLKPFGRTSNKLYHAHLLFKEFMCGTFYLDQMKTVEWVSDTNVLYMEIHLKHVRTNL